MKWLGRLREKRALINLHFEALDAAKASSFEWHSAFNKYMQTHSEDDFREWRQIVEKSKRAWGFAFSSLHAIQEASK